ncbi:MAG: gliding motility-associated C-terminal domain-containing protein [Bacteroidia bacterium]
MIKNLLLLAGIILGTSGGSAQTEVPVQYHFFQGDSLEGFDFNTAYNNLGLYNAKAHLSEDEKNVYMYRVEKAFVQTKYRLPVTLYSLPGNNIAPPGTRTRVINGRTFVIPRAVSISKNAAAEKKAMVTHPSVAASSCHNLDLEQGDLSNWFGSMGWDDYDAAPPAGYPTGQVIYYYGLAALNGPPANGQAAYVGATNSAFGTSCSGVTLVSSGTDPYSGLPMVMPGGGSFSLRMGDDKVNIGAGYAGSCNYSNQVPTWPTYNVPTTWSTSESSGEIVMVSFPVTAANCLLTYNYNVVLNDNNHPVGQQPFFFADIVSAADTATEVVPCSSYFQEARNGVPPTGYNTSAMTAGGGAPVFYSGWQGNTVDLSTKVGTTVILEFYSAGCVPGGHFGYAYVDGSCGPLQFPSTSPTVCAGGIETISAPPTPPGTTYTWSGPGIVGPNNGSSVNVNAPGTYSLTYSLPPPNSGCPITISAVVNFYPQPVITPASTNPVCNGACTGTATVTPSGGTAPYTYSWSNGAGNVSSISSLCAGTYTATLTTANGCSTTHTYTITTPAALANTPSSTNEKCNGSCTGTLGTAVTGGTSGYTYSWSNAAGNVPNQTNVCPGAYTCNITDSKGCTTSSTYTITQPTALNITPGSTTQSSCTSNTGAASVTVSGGTPAYTYTWSPAPGAGQGSPSASAMGAGTYVLTVKDGNLCAQTYTVAITTASGPSSSVLSSTNNICNGGCVGTASVSYSGGTGPYSIVWSPAPGAGQGTANASQMCANNYTATITDANNCVTSQVIAITAPPAVTGAPTTTNTACGATNGSAIAHGTGGTGALTYSWNTTPAQLSDTATNLAGGTYVVTIKDANGCTGTANATIANPGSPVLTTAALNLRCNAVCSGKDSATVSGGNAPYTYSWSNTATTPGINGLCAGIYTCTTKDASGCTVTKVDTIKGPTALAVAPTQKNVVCNGGCNGKAVGTLSGGTGAYTYSWSGNASITDSAVGLCPGTYTLNGTDANGCTTTQSFTITQPNALAANPTSTNIKCNGSNNGQACVLPSGGTPGYNYTWTPTPSSGQGTTCANGLAPGSITCVFSDANGCIDSATFTITQPPALTATGAPTNSTCSQSNGQATASGSGGSPSYSYTWNSGQAVNNITGIPAGIYTCTVKDSLGCTTTVIDTVNNVGTMPAPSIVTASTGTICHGDSALLTASGGGVGSTYTWMPGGSNADSIYAKTGTTYTLTATNACGTVTTTKVITVIAALVPTVTGKSIFCPGKSDTLTAHSTPITVPAATYTWNTSPPTVSPTLIVTGPGNYTVTAINQCDTTTAVFPVATYVITAEFGASVYTGYTPLPVNFIDSSSTSAVSWTWNFGDGTTGSGLNPSHTYNNGGTYVVIETIKDGNGCVSSDTLRIHVTDLPSWIQVPNIFTPNGDGDNDEWAVRYQGISSFDAKIYDRWGVMMSELFAPGQGWDGRTSGGAQAVNGTYYYIITAKGDDGKSYAFNGSLMLIRN